MFNEHCKPVSTLLCKLQIRPLQTQPSESSGYWGPRSPSVVQFTCTDRSVSLFIQLSRDYILTTNSSPAASYFSAFHPGKTSLPPAPDPATTCKVTAVITLCSSGLHNETSLYSGLSAEAPCIAYASIEPSLRLSLQQSTEDSIFRSSPLTSYLKYSCIGREVPTFLRFRPDRLARRLLVNRWSDRCWTTFTELLLDQF